MIFNERLHPSLVLFAITQFVFQVFVTGVTIVAGLSIFLILLQFGVLGLTCFTVYYVRSVLKLDDHGKSYLLLFWMQLLIIIAFGLIRVWNANYILEIFISVFLFAIPTLVLAVIQKGAYNPNPFLLLSVLWVSVYFGYLITNSQNSYIFVSQEQIFPKLYHPYENNVPLIRSSSVELPFTCKHPYITFDPPLPSSLFFDGHFINGTLTVNKTLTTKVNMICNLLFTAASDQLTIVPCESEKCKQPVYRSFPNPTTNLFNPLFWMFQLVLVFASIYSGFVHEYNSVNIIIKS